jgi:Fuc2NAc and GlcNAc transferase
MSALFVFFVRRHALRRGLIDRPNARSSHSVPTPRGGGLGVVLAFLIALAVAMRASLGLVEVIALLATLVVAAIGWVDDHGGASVRVRLAIHLLAAALLLPLVRSIPLLSLPMWAGPAWWIFWTVAAINVVNFMDGIDGIIGLQMLVFGSYVALIGAPGGTARMAGLALAGASLGFLFWNWSPARIFMGDVGSGALGVISVVLGGLAIRDGGRDVVSVFAPLVPLFLDATLTLIGRQRRGERLSDAHRTHLYQRLANGGIGHARVSVGFGACSVLSALIAARFPTGGVLLLGGLLAPSLLAWIVADRWLDRHSASGTQAR